MLCFPRTVKSYLLMVWFYFIISYGHSQVIDWLTFHQSEGLSSGLSSIQTDLQGNVYVAGSFMGSVIIKGDTLRTESNSNDTDSYIVKYNANGSIQWIKKFTGPGHQWIFALTFSPDGYILTTGSFQGKLAVDGFTLTTTPGLSDLGDSFLSKISTYGGVILVKNIGYAETNMADMGGGITTDGTGNIYVAGGRGRSMYYSKLKSNGDLIWRKTAVVTSNIGTSNAGLIAVDKNGYIYIGGSSLEGGHLFKVSSIGETLWSETFQGTIADMKIGPDDQLLISARINQSTTFGNESFPSRGGLIALMTPNGQLSWRSFLPGLRASDLSINSHDSNIYFTGSITTTTQFGLVELTVEEESDKIIGALSYDGLYKWVSKIGEKNGTIGDLITTDPAGSIFIASKIDRDSTGIFQCVEKTGQSKRDFYAGKIIPFINVPIHGPRYLCEGEEGVFHYTPVSDYIIYEWTFDKNNLDVTYVNDTTIKVKPVGSDFVEIGIKTPIDLDCELFVINHSLKVKFGALLAKELISGIDAVCPGQQNVVFTVPSSEETVVNTWVPSGENITIRSITDYKLVLDFSNNFAGGEVGFTRTGKCNTVSYDPIVVSAKPKPGTPGNVAGENLLCAGQQNEKFSIEETENTLSYNWFVKFDNNNPTSIPGTTSMEVSFPMVINNASIWVRAINECGFAESLPFPIQFKYKPQSPSPLLGRQLLCEATETTVEAAIQPNAQQYHWVFKDKEGKTTLNEIHSSNQLSFTFFNSGTLSASAINECGESPFTELVLNKIVDPYVQPVIERTCATLFRQPGDEILHWFKDGELIGTQESIEIKSGGQYELKYIGVCTEQISSVTVDDDEITRFIPNIFTPNGDDKNPTFQVSKFLLGSKLAVYSRWGKLVYDSQNYQNEWSGDGLASGTYFYVLISDCVQSPFKGSITISR